MATAAKRLAHSADGDLFVDATCIDCDTCRWMAPETFTRREEQSSVYRQPRTGEELLHAQMALLSCPTSSIGTLRKTDLRPAQAALPDPIDGDVYHCGYHDQSSYGAASYLLVRADGNVLVDSPRFTGPLVRRIEALGGVRWMFLTHRDDVADHGAFRRHFGCERILHERDVTAGTAGVEIQLTGDEPIEHTDDVRFIPTPGHTAGSACLLFRDRYLLSGDHVGWSGRLDLMSAFRSVCWYDWDVQIESMRRLLSYRFEWILPGHGRRCHFPADEMRRQLAGIIARMEA